jgi:hypothetical protein
MVILLYHTVTRRDITRKLGMEVELHTANDLYNKHAKYQYELLCTLGYIKIT